MGISEKEARKIAEDMIKKTGKNLSILEIDTVEDSDDDIIYLFLVKDNDTNTVYQPGELIPCIRKSNGEKHDIVLALPID